MSVRNFAVVGILIVLIFAYVAWTRNTSRGAAPTAQSQAEEPAPGMPPGDAGGTEMPVPPVIQSGADPGVAWNVPHGWTDRGPGTMRLATYAIKGAGGDAQCAVYYFGAGQGGSVEANVERWRGEFKDTQADTPVRFEAPGAHVTRVGLRGTYLAHAGMMDGVAESLEQPQWALLGAIAEGPNGSVFFKLTGPAATVKAASAEFDRMLKSIHKLGV